jgi:hypothetical protein
MRALRGVLAFIASVAIVAACVITMSSTPVATAADSTSIEAETMKVKPASAGGTVSDSSASGGMALVLRSSATATRSVALSTPASGVVVRARAQSCSSAPVMNLVIDGQNVSTANVSSSSWVNYTTSISIPAGNHSIGIVLANQRKSFYCQLNLLVDTVTVIASSPTSSTTSTTTPTSTTVPTTPTTPGTPGMRMFTGDFTTGNFSQWASVHNRYVNNTGAYYDAHGYSYPATIVTDSGKGYVGRFEVRSGDPGIYGAGGQPRSEVATPFNMPDMTEGKVNWQAFSVMFDPSYPTTASGVLWGLTNQWHSIVDDGGPPFGFYTVANGLWTLRFNKHSVPIGSQAQTIDIWSTPLASGTWHDVKLQVGWSSSDTVGFVRLWHNGVPQTFNNGQTTYYIRTLNPNGANDYYKEGLYRGDRPETGVVYHSGYRFADSEAGL